MPACSVYADPHIAGTVRLICGNAQCGDTATVRPFVRSFLPRAVCAAYLRHGYYPDFTFDCHVAIYRCFDRRGADYTHARSPPSRVAHIGDICSKAD